MDERQRNFRDQIDILPYSETDREEHNNLLASAGGIALSGLARVGNLMDLPGSSVRDFLGGKNPLDQWLPWNWTTDEGRLTGRDLLRQWGAAGKQDTWGNFGGGLALEMALDPLTYLGAGWSRAGKLANMSGAIKRLPLTLTRKMGPRVARTVRTLDDLVSGVGKVVDGVKKYRMGAASDVKTYYNLRDAALKAGHSLDDLIGHAPDGKMLPNSLMHEPLGTPSLYRAELPFTNLGFDVDPLVDATLKLPGVRRAGLSTKSFARGLDAVSNAARFSPLGRLAAQTLSPEAMGFFGKSEQQLAKEIYGSRLDAKSRATRAAAEAFGDAPGQMRTKFEEQMRSTFRQAGVPDEEIDGMLLLHNTFATRRGMKHGKSVEDYYRDAFREIKFGTPEDLLKQHQDWQNTSPLFQNAPALYSKAHRAIQENRGNWLAKGTDYSTLQKMLKKAQITDEEITDLGLQEFLEEQGGKATKEDLENWIASQVGELQEVEGGGKYEEYTVPGGTNYREFLYTNPNQSRYKNEHWDADNVNFHVRATDGITPYGKTLNIEEIQSDLHQAARKKLNAWRLQMRAEFARKNFADVLHANKGRLVLWADRAVEEAGDFVKLTLLDGQVKQLPWTPGKTAVEVAEDFINQAADDAYKTAAKEHGEPSFYANRNNGQYSMSREDRAIAAKWGSLAEDAYEKTKSIAEDSVLGDTPDYPHKKSWSTLAFKKMLQRAVEEGYDAIALNNGADAAKVVKGPVAELEEAYRIMAKNAEKYTKKWGSYVGEHVRNVDPFELKSDGPNGVYKLYHRGLGVLLGTITAESDGTYKILKRSGGSELLPNARSLEDAQQALRDALPHTMPNLSGRTYLFKITDQMRQDILREGQPLWQRNAAKYPPIIAPQIQAAAEGWRGIRREHGIEVVDPTGKSRGVVKTQSADAAIQAVRTPKAKEVFAQVQEVFPGAKLTVQADQSILVRLPNNKEFQLQYVKEIPAPEKAARASLAGKLGREPTETELRNAMQRGANGSYKLTDDSGNVVADLGRIKMIIKSLRSGHHLPVLHHEAIHMVRRVGMILDDEWDILSKHFAQGEKLAPKVIEERIASGFQQWIGEGMPRADANATIFQKIYSQFEKLVKMLTGQDTRTAEDIFRAMKDPEFWKREASTQSTVKSPAAMAMADNAEASKLLYQGTNTYGPKGGVTFHPDDGRALMMAFKGANFSTFAHETAHIWRKMLERDGDELLPELEKAIGVARGAKWTVAQEEAFARGFERYLRDGHAPTTQLQKAFESFKKWMTRIYSSLTGSPLAAQVSPELKKAFDEMLTVERHAGPLGDLYKVFDDAFKPDDFNVFPSDDTLQAARKLLTAENHPLRGLYKSVGGNGDLSRASHWLNQLGENIDPDQAQAAWDATSMRQTPPVLGPQAKGADAAINAKTIADDVLQHVSERMEKVGLKQSFLEAISRTSPRLWTPEELDKFYQAAAPVLERNSRAMQNANRRIALEIQNKGVKLDLLESDTLNHSVRRAAKQAPQKGEFRLASARGSTNAMRAHEIREVPELIVNEMLTDPELRKGDLESQAQHIMDNYLQWLNPKHQAISPHKARYRFADWVAANRDKPHFHWAFEKHKNILDDVQSQHAIETHAYELAQWISVHRKGRVHVAERFQNFLAYQEDAHRLSLVADAIHRFLSDNLSPQTGDSKSLTAVFRHAGMDPETALEHFQKLHPEQTGELFVPAEAGDAVAAMLKAHQPGQWQSDLLKIIDSLTNPFKAAVTVLTAKGAPLFPAFFARNFTSGQFVNLTGGHLRTLQDARNYTTTFRAVAKRMSDEGYRYNQEGLMFGIIGQGRGFDDTIAGKGLPHEFFGKKAVQKTEAILQGADHPYTKPSPMGEWLDTMPGGKRIRKAYHTSTERGANLNAAVEYLNRMPMYVYLRERGWAPEAAAIEVKKLHFDYGALAPAEREVLKRVFPFYTFSRKAAELFITTLMQQPGGPLAQTIRASNRMRKVGPTTPDFISETVAADMGETEDGGHRYFTGLGLPFEDTFSFLGSPQSGALELASRMNPLLKGPLEFATGESFFQRGPGGGRALEDLDPPIGRTLSNFAGLEQPVPTPPMLEHAVANSPLSRLGSSLRTLSDPRKGALGKALNLGTGMRITDVSPRAEDAVLRERLDEAMRKLDAKTFESIYFPDYMEAQMTPEQRAIAQRMEALRRELLRRAKTQAQRRSAART